MVDASVDVSMSYPSLYAAKCTKLNAVRAPCASASRTASICGILRRSEKSSCCREINSGDVRESADCRIAWVVVVVVGGWESIKGVDEWGWFGFVDVDVDVSRGPANSDVAGLPYSSICPPVVRRSRTQGSKMRPRSAGSAEWLT